MKKTGADRQYTEDFRQAAVQQVIEGGRSIPQVARSLEVPKGTLGNWVTRARKGEPITKRSPVNSRPLIRWRCRRGEARAPGAAGSRQAARGGGGGARTRPRRPRAPATTA